MPPFRYTAAAAAAETDTDHIEKHDQVLKGTNDATRKRTHTKSHNTSKVRLLFALRPDLSRPPASDGLRARSSVRSARLLVVRA